MRLPLFLIAALAAGAVMLRALLAGPGFGGYRGPYGDVILGTVAVRCNSPQAVASVTFDYRGFDTLGEEFILFTAVAGALLLLRREREEQENAPNDQEEGAKIPPISDALHLAGMLMFPVTLVLGIVMILHGHLTPGGGFQGGVLVASAFYFIYLAGEYENLVELIPDHLADLLESSGAAAFTLLAAIPVFLGMAPMENFLPGGSYGELLSAGTIPLFNLAVGLEVAAAFLLLISSFLRQALVIRRRGGR